MQGIIADSVGSCERILEAVSYTHLDVYKRQIRDNPEGETTFQIFYQTDPEKVDKLNKILYAELDKMAKNGPDKEMFDKTILNIKKDYAENLKKNGYWLSHMVDFFFDGRDFQTDYEKTLNGITPADVQKIAQELLKQDNHIEVIIRDAKKAK